MKQIAFKLQIFEGPLDLLLHLINKNKVSIYDIPISEITEQYIDYMNEMESYDIELSSEFLVLAANLLYIKSKMILPKDEEEENEEDPRLELAERLAQYKRIKMSTQFFTEREFAGSYLYYKPRDFITPILIDESLKLVTLDSLKSAMTDVHEAVIRRKPPDIKGFKGIVGREPIPVFSKVKAFLTRLKTIRKTMFSDMLKGVRSRDEAVASFLAILELMKMNKVKVKEKNGDYELSYTKKGNDKTNGD